MDLNISAVLIVMGIIWSIASFHVSGSAVVLDEWYASILIFTATLCYATGLYCHVESC